MKATIRMLQLDSSDMDLQEARNAVMRAGFVPRTTAIHTLEKFNEHLNAGESFDVLLVEPDTAVHPDPVRGPLALLDAVQSRPDPIPLIFVARRLNERLAEEAYRHGAFGFVLKKKLDQLGPLLGMIGSPHPELDSSLNMLDSSLNILHLCHDPVVVVEAEVPHTIRFANPAFERRSGCVAGDIVGHPLSSVDGPQRAFLAAIKSVTGVSGPGRVTVHKTEGEYECWLDAQRIPVACDNGPCVAIMARETTSCHRDDETVQWLREQLFRSQKMHSVAVLASGIAHDLNNILTGIFGSAELARMSLDPGHPACEDLDTIVQASQRAASLTKELLSYAFGGSRDAEVVDLNQMVTNILVILRSQVSKSVIVRKALALDAPKVCVNVPEIQQVLMNLCLNASKAMSDRGGGVLSIVTDRAVLDQGACTQMEYGVPSPGEYAVFEVVDTGPGLPDVAPGQLFQPFFSTQGAEQGLGLAAVLRIVTAHRGAIRVYSDREEGSSFRVFLPATAQTLPKSDESPRRATQQQRTILFVDDEEMLRSFGRRCLEHFGYRVLLAADGVEAVRMYHEHKAEIDLVVLDLSMPRKGGEDAYREMQAIRPDVRVLLSCGYDQQSAVEKLAPDGPVAFLAKPFGMDQLVREVERALVG
ncbi:MAG: hybrid sensor histidine kinase/response regulator [Acidiferrobacteraceae bacterium]